MNLYVFWEFIGALILWYYVKIIIIDRSKLVLRLPKKSLWVMGEAIAHYFWPRPQRWGLEMGEDRYPIPLHELLQDIVRDICKIIYSMHYAQHIIG